MWWILAQIVLMIKAPFKFAWWIGAQAVWLSKAALRVIFKIVWLLVGPVLSMSFQYVILPLGILQVIKDCGWTPAVASYSGPVLFHTFKFFVDSSRATMILTLLSIWCCLYPFFVVSWALVMELAGISLFALGVGWRVGRWCFSRLIKLSVGTFRRCIKASWWSVCLAVAVPVVGFIVLERGPVLLTMLKAPMSLRLWYYYKITAPYYRFLRVPLELWYKARLLPYHAYPAIFFRESSCALYDSAMFSEVTQAIDTLRFYWDWVGAPTLGMLSQQEINLIWTPPAAYVVADSIMCPVQRLRAANRQLEKRINDLEDLIEEVDE
ncbi:hypothetical protein B0H15DRAFT_834913 [Mycena belliarum]|uniref:Uncharacterized protein n=1 Tax=Mycena belliarum TaxID=1033014 RepID=A0AAD6U727_9AGAR|nr:hypothetical protein B0H15DRAFT_834913 [Mycena belliae]